MSQDEQNSDMAETSVSITIYQYHPVSGEYLWSQEYTPPVGVGLPAYSTESSPPAVGSNQIQIFNGGEWFVVPDYRGQTFYRKADRTEIIIQDIGNVSEDLTSLPPTTIFDTWKDGAWVTNTVAAKDASLLTQISDLEHQVTPRRIREAILGIDNGWLAQIEDQIEDLRVQLS